MEGLFGNKYCLCIMTTIVAHLGTMRQADLVSHTIIHKTWELPAHACLADTHLCPANTLVKKVPELGFWDH